MTAPAFPSLRLVADDLTGALDSAAPFATPQAPVRVLLVPAPPPLPDRCAISSESRDLPLADAVAAATRAAAALRPGAGPHSLWFKKIDSTLRGHPFAETAAILAATGCAHCVVCPAFPAEGRITRAGRHGLLREGRWTPLPEGDLAAAVARAGLAATIVAEAETQDALRRAIAPWRGRAGLLWAGARGLAEALAGAPPALPMPAVAAVVAGTTHPTTRAQLARLAASGPRAAILDCTAGAADAAATQAAVHRLFAGRDPQAALPDAGAIVVVGGATLAAALAAAGAQALELAGEVAPGLPLARIVGGRLAGRTVVTRSGGFGGPEDLAALVARGAPGLPPRPLPPRPLPGA